MLKTIKVRLIILTALLLGALIFIGVFSMGNLNRVNDNTAVISKDYIPAIIDSEELNTMTSDFRILEMAHVISTDNTAMDGIEQELGKKQLEIEALMKRYKEKIGTEEERKLYDTVEADWEDYTGTSEKIIALSRELKTAEAMTLINAESRQVFDRSAINILKLVEYNKKLAMKASQDGDEIFDQSMKISVTAIVLLSIGAIFLATVIISRIVKSLSVLKSELRALAERGGDLTQEIAIDSEDEIGDLAKALNMFLSNLRVIIQNVKQTTETTIEANKSMGMSLSDLASNIDEVSATTEELSAGMEETAASAEEITATTEEIERAAESIAQKSQEGAVAAGDINKRAVETKTMAIQAQSKATEILSETKVELEAAIEDAKVVDQINVLSEAIMDITAQTNLLALNAAIEAARAGEAGRGFSVVAEEIRKLAHQSEESVNQILGITNKVTKSVENLSGSSNKLLEFMSENVVKDYEALLNIAEKYTEDAYFVDNLVTDFSSTSEELLASVQDALRGVEQVANAANEGAEGTTNIAEKVVYVDQKAGEVVKLTEKSMMALNELKLEVEKFTV